MTGPQGALGRGLGGVALALGLGLLGLACPSRALLVEVSDSGLTIIAAACNNHDGSCVGFKQRAPCESSIACAWDSESGTCQVREPCVHKGSPAYDGQALKAIRVALVRSDPFGLEVSSRCYPVVIPDDPSCKPTATVEERRHCATLAANEAIDRALGAGLGFDGFHDPSVAFPVVALYQPTTLPAGCVSTDPAERRACAEQTLPCTDAEIVGCAGLAVPINEQAYDLTCASCQDGLHFSLGRDNGPCPQVAGHCFFEACAKLFARADLP